MKNIVLSFFIIAIILMGCRPSPSSVREVDVCIYGGNAAGVIAAYSAKKMGKSVLLVEPGTHLGGLTTGGLGRTDIGNKYAITGLSRDFYRRVGKLYGEFEGWTFSPSVARKAIQQYVDEAQIEILYQKRIISATNKNAIISQITLEDSENPDKEPRIHIKAKQYIDCSYEGDLMARAGVSYTVGREDNSRYNETWNGVQLPEYRQRSGYHQFPDGVDPYKVPGDPSSGLLWGISADKLQPNGTGDKKVQAYNFRICLTNEPDNLIPITKPDNYDPERYELLARLFEAQPKDWPVGEYLIWSHMPGNKTDINNRGAFSTDMIGMNYDYPEASYDERKKIIREHEDYTKGLLYFYITDPRVPGHLQEEISKWGYPKDEYPEHNHWSPQLYVREVRRMVGSYVMTEAHCTGKETVTDDIGMAAYGMDSHNCARIVINKDGKDMVKNEGNVEIGVAAPYPISYRSLLPQKTECGNLLVPVCLSASHIAYGSIRMEPVFMVLGQSSAVAACLAIDAGTGTHEVDVERIKKILTDDPLLDGSTPEIMVDDTDDSHTQIEGDWENRRLGHYKTGFKLAPKSGKGVSFSFLPRIEKSGKYHIYFHCPIGFNPGQPVKIAIDILSSSGTGELVFDPQEYKEKSGGSGSYWYDLGVYDFKAGEKAGITVNGAKSVGPVFADAVILKNVDR